MYLLDINLLINNNISNNNLLDILYKSENNFIESWIFNFVKSLK